MKKMMMTASVCAAVLFFGCGEDEKVGGGSGGSGGKATGGTGGKSDGGGAGGTGGATGGTAGGGAAGTSGDAAPPARLLVVGTDFSQSEVATIDVATGNRIGGVTISDGDVVPAGSGSTAFALERTNAKVDVLDPSGAISKTIDVGASAVGETVTGSTNPVNVAVVGNKAYVVLGAANKLAVVDLGAGSVSKAIDLSSYHSAGDQDGAVDAVGAIVKNDRVYFVLGRIDRTTIAAPDYQLACPTVKPLVMAIDTTTDQIADLNGAAAGEGIELGLANPVDLGHWALDSASSLVVLSAGCFAPGEGGKVRVSAGIEELDLGSGLVSTIYSSPTQDYLARILVPTSSTRLLNTFDTSFAEHWYEFVGTSPNELSGVPAAPSLEGGVNFLGVKFPEPDAGSTVELVRYTIATEQSVTFGTNPWTGSFSSVAGTALVQ